MAPKRGMPEKIAFPRAKADEIRLVVDLTI